MNENRNRKTRAVVSLPLAVTPHAQMQPASLSLAILELRTMSTMTPRLITPDCQPEFPCWLWCPPDFGYQNKPIEGYWYKMDSARRYEYDKRNSPPTYWHPDQPTAPTCVPEQETSGGKLKPLPGTTFADTQPATGTPRTDAEVTRVFAVTNDDAQRVFLLASFARTLERELAEMSAESQRNREAAQTWASKEHGLRVALTAQREAHEREMAANHVFKLCFPYPADISMKPALFKDGGYHYYVPEEEADDLRTHLTAAERRLALADELAGALEDMTIAFVTTFTASHDQKDAATCKAVSALTRYRAATAPTTATKD
jgi:hypothetical protein